MKTEINGKKYEFEELWAEETAVDTLRLRCQLTGTKLVCGSGVCGACTIRVNGTPMVSCLLPAHHLDGQSVTTIEHYRDEQLHPIQKAFMAYDGLQCGFCTPGFIIESIAFYEHWREKNGRQKPTREAIAEALAGHLCRCGAYVGIYAAVEAACAGDFDDVTEVSAQRVDALVKVIGAAKYTADIQLSGQLVGKILRSSQAHAHVFKVDASAAAQLPGVKAVVAANESFTVRYVGQTVASVAAVDEATAAAALAAIAVEYHPLATVIGFEAATADDAPDIWQNAHRDAPSAGEGLTLPGTWDGNLRKGLINTGGLMPGRAQRAFEQAQTQGQPNVTAHFSNGIQVHTALEPHCAVARWLDDTHLELYLSTQAVSDMRTQVAERFDLPPENVTILAEHVGGDFGAKNYLFDEAIAAVELAKLAGAPVAVVPDRAEEMTVGGMRPGGRFEMKMAADSNGELLALISHAYSDSGIAVGNITSSMTGMGYAGGARDLLDYDVVNNHAPGKPFRGPGGPGAMWAVEQAVDQLAYEGGFDPIQLRRRWTKNEQRLKLYDWVEALAVWQNRHKSGRPDGRFRRGVGVAFGHWLYIYDPKARIQLESTASGFTVSTSTQEIGNGVRTSLARIVADVFGLAATDVQIAIGSSDYVHGPRAGGSRVTTSIYEPTEQAATLLRDRLFGLAAETFDLVEAKVIPGGIAHREGKLGWLEVLAGLPPQQVTAERGADKQLVQRVASRVANRMMGMDMMIGSGLAQGAVVVGVEVDTLLGKTRVLRVWENLAVGRTFFPDMARSQVYGGIIQGIGYALYEEKILDKTTGQNLTSNLQDYCLPGLGDTPEIMVTFTDGGFDHVTGQGIGLSELCTVPVGAAVANAVFNATGWRPLESPIKPERMLAGMKG